MIIRFYKSLLLISSLAISFCCDRSEPDTTLPDLIMVVQPIIGSTETVFFFHAIESMNRNKIPWKYSIKWDFDSDGVWETDYTHEFSQTHKYNDEGIYCITAKIKNPGGYWDSLKTNVYVKDSFRFGKIIDTRNGNEYRTTQQRSTIWMADNLVLGKVLENGREPKDNGVPEYYSWDNNIGFYSWEEATNYGRDTIQGLCPDGWRLPKVKDYKELITGQWFIQDMRIITGTNGYSDMHYQFNGFLSKMGNQVHRMDTNALYWLTSRHDKDYFCYFIKPSYHAEIYSDRFKTDTTGYTYPVYKWLNKFNLKSLFLNVRCVQDKK